MAAAARSPVRAGEAERTQGSRDPPRPRSVLASVPAPTATAPAQAAGRREAPCGLNGGRAPQPRTRKWWSRCAVIGEGLAEALGGLLSPNLDEILGVANCQAHSVLHSAAHTGRGGGERDEAGR